MIHKQYYIHLQSSVFLTFFGCRYTFELNLKLEIHGLVFGGYRKSPATHLDFFTSHNLEYTELEKSRKGSLKKEIFVHLTTRFATYTHFNIPFFFLCCLCYFSFSSSSISSQFLFLVVLCGRKKESFYIYTHEGLQFQFSSYNDKHQNRRISLENNTKIFIFIICGEKDKKKKKNSRIILGSAQ